MEAPLKILILEDETDVCQRFKEEIQLAQDMELVNITNSSSEAMELVAMHNPDVIIVDLELHFGKGNGLQFLEMLKEASLISIPYTIVTTNNSSTTTYSFARTLGADFIMYKQQEGYSEKYVIDFLRTMHSIIRSRHHMPNPLNATSETPEQRQQRFRRIVCTEMDAIHINQKSVGYQYLVDGILLSLNSHQPNLISIISEKYNKTPASVERAMQYAINRAWRTTDIEDLLFHYTAKIHSSRGVPTITEFICYYANKIRNEY